jgi:ferredoxin
MRTALESVHLVAATIGFISFAALWAGTLWGSVLRSGWASSRLRHSTVHGMHMHLILLGLTLGVVHGVVQLAAPGGKVRVIDVVIPFTDRADPIGVGFGVLALELMLATALSVLVQRKLGWHRWRALHSLGYLSFTLVAAHLLISGSEVAAAPVRAAIAVAWAMVAVTGAATIAPVARLPRMLLERVARRHRAEEITVAVDAGRCASFGFCEQEAPAIFTLRSDRRLAYRSMVSSDQAEAATRAAVVCPARAITLGRLPTAVVLAQPADEVVEPAGEPAAVPVAASLAPVFQPAPAAGRRGGEPGRRGGETSRPAAEPLRPTGSAPMRPAASTGSVPRQPAGPAPVRGPAESAPVPVAAVRAAVGRPGPRGPTESAPVPVSAVRAAVGRPVRDAVGRDAVGRDAVGRDAVGRDAVGRDAVGRDAVGRPGTGRDAVGRDAVGRSGSGRPGGEAVGRPGRGVVDPATAPRGVPAAGRPRGVPPATAAEPLPPPSELQDTGRHHLPPLRGLPGGRSGSGR